MAIVMTFANFADLLNQRFQNIYQNLYGPVDEMQALFDLADEPQPPA